LSVALDAVIGDDIIMLSDAAQIAFGANSEVTLTHVHDNGLALKHTATADDKPVVLILQTGETDIAADDVLGGIDFMAPDEGTGTDAVLTAAGIAAVSEGDFSSSNNATKLSFKTAASEAASEKMSLSSIGDLTIAGDLIIKDGGTIGSASDTDAIIIDSAGRIQVNGTAIVDVGRISVSFNSADSTGVSVKCLNANGGTIMRYHNSSNASIGGITSDGSTTAFATSSDYRLKENVDYTWDATTRLKQLKPARFNFIADESNTLVDGFIAHEVSSIVPEAIIGEKDATEMQGIDQSKLVPLLVKTIQELEARIKTLEDA